MKQQATDSQQTVGERYNRAELYPAASHQFFWHCRSNEILTQLLVDKLNKPTATIPAL